MQFARKSIGSDSNSSSYSYMGKQVAMDADSNEPVVLRNDENEKLKDKLCYGGGSTDAEMLSSWPPRLYTCSFCKRRFKSAQALGGHMNVHRRARAMLRSQSSSPWLSNNIISADNHFKHDGRHSNDPNPSPNSHCPLYTSQYPTTKHSPSDLLHLPMLTNLSPSCSLVTTTHKNSILPASCNCKHMLQAHAELTTRERFKKNCIMAEKHSNGLCSKTRVHRPDQDMVSRRPAANQEDIDLELRLGF